MRTRHCVIIISIIIVISEPTVWWTVLRKSMAPEMFVFYVKKCVVFYLKNVVFFIVIYNDLMERRRNIEQDSIESSRYFLKRFTTF